MSNEISNRNSAVNAVSNALSNEISNRQSASAALESHVNTVSAAVVVASALATTADTHANTVSAAIVTAISAETLAAVTGRGATTTTAVSITNATAATTNATGALIVTGGIGVGGNIYVGGTAYCATFSGDALTAKYADLAENYTSDARYEAGTVVQFGELSEVTQSTQDATTRVVGVVSTQPAYLMNNALTGEFVVGVALLGRVPCKVRGPISKGDLLVAAVGGFARAEANPKVGTVIGKSLEPFYGEEGVVEIIVGLK